MKRILGVVFVNAILILAILYSFEFLASPFRKLPHNNGVVDGQRYTWGHLVTNNRFGFREREFVTPKPEDAFRVMVLGDSLTWGAGLSPEQRYTSIAEAKLKAQFPDRTIEVLNFGIEGGPTIIEQLILSKLADTVEPDLVVVGFCLNDPQPRRQNYSMEREKLNETLVARAVYRTKVLLEGMHLRYVGKILNDAFYRSAERLGLIPTWQTALQRTYDPNSEEWKLFIHALQEIKRVSDNRGLAEPIFAILNQGSFTDRPTDYANPDPILAQYLKWYSQAESAARIVGYNAYNHEQDFKDQINNTNMAVNIMDGHPSSAVNEIYGTRLAMEISGYLSPQVGYVR